MSKAITTPKGKAVWPRVATPDTKFDEDGVYSCKLHVSEADFKAFEAEINPRIEAAYKAESERLGKSNLRKAATSPLRITEDGDFEIYAKQKAKVHTKSKGTLEFSVACYDSRGKKMAAVPSIGSGSVLKMAVDLNTWYVPSQGFGYSLRLRAVQIIELIEHDSQVDHGLGFGKEAGGFVDTNESFNETFEAAEDATEAPTPTPNF